MRVGPTTPVLFLDIDGVLNSHHWWDRRPDKMSQFDPQAVARLNQILDVVPECLIVVSSSWRLLYALGLLVGTLEWVGVRAGRVADKTPDGSRRAQTGPLWVSVQRGDEIAQWRADHEHVGPFAVLDDDGDMDAVVDHFVQTDCRTGLLDEHVSAVIELLTENKADDNYNDDEV